MECNDMDERTLENIKTALEHEEEAVSLYTKFADECKIPFYKEMFMQFAKNENWHVLALKEKLKKIDDEKACLDNV